MRLWLLLGCAALLEAQPVIQTELREGVRRADVRHAADRRPVTDENPARPGEQLLLNAAGASAQSALWVGGAETPFEIVEDGMLAFAMPAEAGGSFVEIVLTGARAETFPAQESADAI